MTPPDVFLTARELGIENIYQPVNLKKENFEEILLKEAPELIAVVAYGKLLPEYVLDYPKFGCINVHGSLLPKYRGAAPMQWAVIDGEKETGVTTMYMDKGLDTGDMLLKASIPLEITDNFGTVHDKLAQLGASLLVETIDNIHDIKRIPQGETTTPYAAMITKETMHIDWTKDALSICNLIRGLCPFPKAFCIMDNKNLKILRALPEQYHTNEPCGTVIALAADSFDVACGGGTVLRVFSIQPEAKKVTEVSEYFKGNSIPLKTLLS